MTINYNDIKYLILLCGTFWQIYQSLIRSILSLTTVWIPCLHQIPTINWCYCILVHPTNKNRTQDLLSGFFNLDIIFEAMMKLKR